MSSYNFILTEVFKKEHQEPEYYVSYREGHKNCGLKVGDYVRVVRKSYKGERGWDCSWTSSMSKHIGDIGKITGSYEGGFELYFYDGSVDHFVFPYFVLEKVD